MRQTLKVALVILYGCSKCDSPGAEPTPMGYPVVCPATFQLQSMSKAEVMRLVDYRVSEWIAAKAAWGLSGYSDETLAAYAKLEPIIVVDSDHVVKNGQSYGGWNEYGCYILIAIYQAAGGENMAGLPHELTHSVLGSFHLEGRNAGNLPRGR